jgi:hypothetical protein
LLLASPWGPTSVPSAKARRDDELLRLRGGDEDAVSGSSIRCEVGGPSPEAHRELKISPAEFDEVAAASAPVMPSFLTPVPSASSM